MSMKGFDEVELQVVSISNAPIEIREKASFSDAAKLSFYELLAQQGITNAMILSTCNRCEIYAVVKEDELLYAIFLSFIDTSLHPYVMLKKGNQAIQHGLRVCGGLESILLGEDQIFHQMKEAYMYAQAAGMIQKELHFYFQSVFRIIKQLKTTWKINEQPLTTTYVAWQFILKQRKLDKETILLCGSGEVIQDFFPYLKQHQGSIYIASRDEAQAKTFQKQFPFLSWISIKERMKIAAKADIIISATSSPHIMFPYQKHWIKKAVLMIDLALPRDIDPAYRQDFLVELKDIDEIQKTLYQAQSKRQELAKQASIFIEEESVKLSQQWLRQKQEPLYASMQKQLLQMAEHTYMLLDRKLSLEAHEQKIMKKTLEYSFTKYMKQWIEVVENMNPEEQQAYVRVLQQLEKEESNDYKDWH